VKPLRLLVVTPRFWPLVAGPHRGLERLAAELRRAGHQVTVLTLRWQPEWPADVQHEGVRIVRLPLPTRGAWGTWRHMRRLARWALRHRGRFDLAYVCRLRHEAYAMLRVAQRAGLAVVLRAERAGPEGDCFWQLDARCGRRIKRACFQADAFVAPARGIERELIAAGYARDRIHYLPSGAPLPEGRSPLRGAAARAGLARAQPALAVAEGTPLAVWTGRMERSAGLAHLVRSWAAVVRERPGAKLWLVGDGPVSAELAEQIHRERLAGSVSLAGAFDSVDDVLQAADVYVCPTTDEGPCLGLLEALAAGLPVVASDIPGHAGFAEHEQHALLVPDGDPPALAAAVLRVMNNPALARRLGEAARTRVGREFTVEQMVEGHLAVFEAALARHGQQRSAAQV
jgi:glycosyltransferase involved in cell wall biosynthesis